MKLTITRPIGLPLHTPVAQKIADHMKNERWKGLNWYFPKDAHQKSEGVSEIRFMKIRLLHLGNVEKPHHPQLSAQRACEG